MNGPLALVGGGEWQDGCDVDLSLLATLPNDPEVVVLPTAAAYEKPDQVIARAAAWFESLGGRVRALRVFDRKGAMDPDNAAAARAARFLYLSDGSPLHLRSVLMHSPLWEALAAAWQAGAVVAGSAAGAGVLCDPMVDPRGGAFTVGLGLVAQLAVVPHADTWSEDKLHRTLQLAPAGLPVVGIDQRTAVVRDPDGSWRAAGPGSVHVWIDGVQRTLAELPA